jgi:hypothetical protein
MKNTLSRCELITLPRVTDPRGNLTFIENDRHVPFPIKRVFYLYDVPGGASRAGHALKHCHQFIIAASGSFDVILDDGHNKAKHHLNRSYYGLYLPPLIWREIVLASECYDESDYFRNYEDFLAAVRANPE